jgi:hypothetical protein
VTQQYWLMLETSKISDSGRGVYLIITKGSLSLSLHTIN